MKYLIVVLFSLFHFITWSQVVNQKDKCQLYLEIIKKYGDKSAKYLIKETTTKSPIINHLELYNQSKKAFLHPFCGPPLDSINTKLFYQYIVQSDKPENIRNIIELDSTNTFKVLTQKEFEDIFNNKKYQSIRKDFGFIELERRYPDCRGYYAFSSLIYSEDVKHVICYMENDKYSKACNGFLVFLEKSEKEWFIKYMLYLWGS